MPLRLTVPPLRPSRIDFPDERILSVVVDSSHVEVRGESDRSDFFLLPKYPGSTTLFVTLARGETVPVEVTVREDAKPRNVVLHLKDRNAMACDPIPANNSINLIGLSILYGCIVVRSPLYFHSVVKFHH